MGGRAHPSPTYTPICASPFALALGPSLGGSFHTASYKSSLPHDRSITVPCVCGSFEELGHVPARPGTEGAGHVAELQGRQADCHVAAHKVPTGEPFGPMLWWQGLQGAVAEATGQPELQGL